MNSQVCCHHRNRHARSCPEMVNDAFLADNFQEVVCPTGVLMAILLHWISIRRNDEKNGPLAQIICNMLIFSFPVGNEAIAIIDSWLQQEYPVSFLVLMNTDMNLRPIGALAFWLLNLESVPGLSIDLGNGAPRLNWFHVLLLTPHHQDQQVWSPYPALHFLLRYNSVCVMDAFWSRLLSDKDFYSRSCNGCMSSIMLRTLDKPTNCMTNLSPDSLKWKAFHCLVSH